MSQGIRATLHYLTSACGLINGTGKALLEGTPATVSQCAHCYRALWRLPAHSEMVGGNREEKKNVHMVSK